MRNGVPALAVALVATLAPPAAAQAPATATTTSTGATTTTEATAAAPDAAPLAATPLPLRCPSAGAIAIVTPGAPTVALGAAPGSLGAGSYPAAAPVVSFGAADVAGSACSPGDVSVRSLSLFGGAVTADAVSASGGRGSVTDLRVDGAPVALDPGESAPVDGWGLLIAADQVDGTLTAPLALHLLEPRGQLPAGSVLLVGFGARPAAAVAPAAPRPAATPPAPRQVLVPGAAAPAAPATAPATRASAGERRRRRHAARRHLPLTVTPPLGLRHYVFPVARGADWTDTYGGPRSDVEDGWHHGDDLFAPLGTPVLAVASGTLSLVGWNALGGWRVWLEDGAGDRFYYAHLAAYSNWILRHRHVRAGQVIGFLGRTGDAFTTPPHLHFEVHPRQLASLGYDGAVDPSSYLRAWRIERPRAQEVPRPARLRAPRGVPREEAAVVWRQLLAARGDAPAPSPASAPPLGAGVGLLGAERERRTLAAAGAVAAARPTQAADGPWPLLALAAMVAAAAAAALLVRRAERRA